jgi:cell fate (sporulation/competence/biofilm development) regulator YlbF (YheA/YmcA/DUF963 family)
MNMNVYDKAYELARGIKESTEYIDMKQLNDKIAADTEAKRVLDDFRARQVELQQRMMSGDMPPKEDMEKMEKMYEVIILNPEIRKLFEVERRLSVIMDDLQRIITEPIQDMYK